MKFLKARFQNKKVFRFRLRADTLQNSSHQISTFDAIIIHKEWPHSLTLFFGDKTLLWVLGWSMNLNLLYVWHSMVSLMCLFCFVLKCFVRNICKVKKLLKEKKQKKYLTHVARYCAKLHPKIDLKIRRKNVSCSLCCIHYLRVEI